MFQNSLSGVMAASRDLGVVSNNLANAMSVGFKRSTSQFLTTTGFEAAAVRISETQGPLKATQSALDFALTGNGHFVFKDPNALPGVDASLVYSRAAQLKLSPDGNLVDSAGHQLMGLTTPNSTTPIEINLQKIPGLDVSKISSITVDTTGALNILSTNGVTTRAGTVAIARFPNEQGLRAQGASNVIETERSGAPIFTHPGTNGAGVLKQGMLEEANVDITVELLRMIQLQQAYNANSRALQTSSEIYRSTTETIAR